MKNLKNIYIVNLEAIRGKIGIMRLIFFLVEKQS